MISNESIMFDDQLNNKFGFQKKDSDTKLDMGGMDLGRDFEMQIHDNNKSKEPANKKYIQ